MLPKYSPKATYFNMNLTEDQKNIVRDNYASTPDLIELTRLAFDNDSLDGRTKEGRAVREYMAGKDYRYKTTKKHQLKFLFLSRIFVSKRLF